jgi:hypothetical protein
MVLMTGEDWAADASYVCAMCNKAHKMEKLCVCRKCFNRVMNTVDRDIVPVLFAKWSKEDAV